MKKQTQKIFDYYELCENDYRRFWDLDHSLAMHSGYWDETTKNLRDALRRENEVIAEMIGIKKGDRVLDAGCGVGGSSLFLADLGCSVDGINIAPFQVDLARDYAAKVPVEKRPRYHVMDYTSTSFLDGTFDVVWAIESVCHAEDKEAFIREAYRVLKPGGKLMVADGFLIEEGKGMDIWLDGWAVPNLATLPGFEVCLKKAQFRIIQSEDISKQVMPSSRRLYWVAIATTWISYLGEWIGFRTRKQTNNLRAAYWHHKTLQKGMWRYYVVIAQKKENE